MCLTVHQRAVGHWDTVLALCVGFFQFGRTISVTSHCLKALCQDMVLFGADDDFSCATDPTLPPHVQVSG